MKINRNSLRYNTLGNAFHNNMVSTPGPHRHGQRGITPSTKKFSIENDVSLFNITNINKKSDNSIFDDFNNNNISNNIEDVFNGIYKGKKNSNLNNFDNGQTTNFGITEDKLDYDQKQYLEKYKSFLSGLDNQLSP